MNVSATQKNAGEVRRSFTESGSSHWYKKNLKSSDQIIPMSTNKLPLADTVREKMISEYFAVSQNKEEKWVFSLSVWGEKNSTLTRMVL